MQTIESIIEEAVARGVARALAEHPPASTMPEGAATMSIKEAAEVVGVSVPKMYEISHMESFPACLTVGRKRVILRHKLYDWLDAQAEGVVVD